MIKHTELKERLKKMNIEFKPAKKTAIILARKGIPGEILEVRCSDGILETTQTVTENQMVIKNVQASNEIYAVNTVDFEQRYEYIIDKDDIWKSYKSKGTIKYIVLDYVTTLELEDLYCKDGSIEFEPAWGGVMKVLRGDILAISDTNGSLYRIAKHEFYKTYEV